MHLHVLASLYALPAAIHNDPVPWLLGELPHDCRCGLHSLRIFLMLPVLSLSSLFVAFFRCYFDGMVF